MISTAQIQQRKNGEQPMAAATIPKEYLVFRLVGHAYALALEEVAAVLPLAELAHPPAAPGFLAGFLNLEGEAIPVLNLSRLFKVPEHEPGLYTPLIVLRNRENRLALQVEEVNRIESFSREQTLALQDSHSFNDCATGVVKLAGQVVLLLSAERLLLEKERQYLAELEAMEQERLNAWEKP